jgi:hypothetical protein
VRISSRSSGGSSFRSFQVRSPAGPRARGPEVSRPWRCGRLGCPSMPSRVSEKSAHCLPVQARLSVGSDEPIRLWSAHAVVPRAVGWLRCAVPAGGLTHEIHDRSVQSRACRLSLRDGVCRYRATGRVPIGALPSIRRDHGSDRPSRPVSATQHVTTREANHHDDQTAQYLVQHGASRSGRGRPGRGHARRAACRRRDLPAGEGSGHRVLPGDGGRLPSVARLGPQAGGRCAWPEWRAPAPSARACPATCCPSRFRCSK